MAMAALWVSDKALFFDNVIIAIELLSDRNIIIIRSHLRKYPFRNITWHS